MHRIFSAVKSSFLVSLMTLSCYVTSTLLVTVTPALADVYDDFKNGFYSLSNGEISPDGKWQNVYNGGGSSGVGISGSKHVFYIYPKASTSSSETNANLVISTQQLSNFTLNINVNTAEQLRRNDPPNNWEVAWVLFRYTDTFHYYWFALKPGGVELGKKDCSGCTNSFKHQEFLSTVDYPNLKVGDWSSWKITAVGNHIRLAINGTDVIDFVDHKMSDKLAKGSIGLYGEDVYAEFDSVNITRSST